MLVRSGAVGNAVWPDLACSLVVRWVVAWDVTPVEVVHRIDLSRRSESIVLYVEWVKTAIVTSSRD
mgnify:CR=1 FL=1